MKRYILLIVMAAIVASCGVYKPYSRQEINTAGLYGARYETTDTTSIADLRWDEFFRDPHLQKLITQGLESNTDMQAAQLRIEAAEATLKAARLAYLPSFNLTPNGGVSSFKSSAGSWTYSAPISASWQLDIFGGITNAKRKAKAVYAESQEYSQAVRTQLISAIANYYYTLLMLDSQREVTRLTAESLNQSATTMRSMMDAGMSNRAAVSQMEAAAYDALTSLMDIDKQISDIETSLSTLLGDTPHAIERGTLQSQEFPEEITTGVPLRLLANRPDVRIAEFRLMQAHYATAAARSALYPTITLSGLAGWTNNAGAIITNPGGLILSAAASLTAPIFNGGKLRAQLKVAKAQQEETRLAFQQSILNAGGEVNSALTAIETARGKRSLRTMQIAALESAAESTALMMQYGSTTYLEVLTAQQNLLAGQIAQINDRYEEITGCITLYSALGGGRATE
ncbi:MAG: efflux transporter outer membrane subunit [Alistipes sp.]|nr:efflux transporter outer membrane subunit [Alistipes sp.]